MKRSISFLWAIIAVLCIFDASPGLAQEPSDAGGLSFRLSGGGGYGVGSNSGVYRLDHGSLDLQSVTGGSGPLVTANLWVDRLLSSDFSVGVEFLRLTNGATANLDLPRGVSILTDPTDGQAKLSASADMAFLDLAFRPSLNSERFAFSVGGGFGGGTGKASANFTVYNPAIGKIAEQSAVNSVVAGVHGFVAIDFYLTKSIFLSVSPQLLYITGHPIGVHQSYLDMMTTSSIGYFF